MKSLQNFLLDVTNWRSIATSVVLALVVWAGIAASLVGLSDVWSTLSSPHRLSISQLGSFGDSFALLTCFFSGLAFAAVIVTLNAQKLEMKEMREQMRLDRLNDHFVFLLSELKAARSEVKVQKSANFLREGEDGIFEIHTELVRQFKIRASEHQGDPLIKCLRETIRGGNDPIITGIYRSARRYFALMRAIIEVISNSPRPERSPYTTLVRAFLSNSDLFLIHHYFLANTDSDFHEKIEDIELFAPLGAIFSLVSLAPGPFYKPAAYACDPIKWEAMIKAMPAARA